MIYPYLLTIIFWEIFHNCYDDANIESQIFKEAQHYVLYMHLKMRKFAQKRNNLGTYYLLKQFHQFNFFLHQYFKNKSMHFGINLVQCKKWTFDFLNFLSNDLFSDLISWQDCCLFVSVDKYTHFCTSQDVLLHLEQKSGAKKNCIWRKGPEEICNRKVEKSL